MNARLSHFIRYQLPAVVWAGIIFYVSSLPSSVLPKIKVAAVDKVVHVGIFFVFGLLLYRGLHPMQRSTGFEWRRALIALMAVALYGIVDELHQGFVPGRTVDVWDVCADAVGGILAIVFLKYVARRRSLPAER